MFSVYKITCDKTGKSYIGVTVIGIELRFARHKRLARIGHTGMPIYDAIRAFGEDAFTVELVYEAATKEEMFTVERGLIAAHGTMVPRGYNLARGGFGGYHAISEAGRLSRSEKMKALWADPEFRARQSVAISAGQASPEVRAKMSAGIGAAHRKPGMQDAARERINKRRDQMQRFSPERIERYKASMKKHWESEDFRKKQADITRRVAAERKKNVLQ